MYDFENMDKRYVIFGNIFLLSNRLQTVMDQNAEELTAKQWFVLIMLGMFEEPPTLKQLSGICDSSHQNTKQLVLKLEKKGFVRIEEDKDDRRAMRIHVTIKWQQWNQDNLELTEDFISTMFGSVTEEEIAAFHTAQQKVYDTLGDMRTRSFNKVPDTGIKRS